MTITLNADQQAACAAIREWLNGPGRFFTLTGYAGTGKTTTIHQALADYSGRVAYTAPTHKAVAVLAGMGAAGTCATIHKLLGCKRQYKNNQLVFSPSFDGEEMIRGFDLVVLDECSMVGEQMFRWVQDLAIEHGVRVIFMGDAAQLQPVGDGDESPTFRLQSQARLERIMRNQGVVQLAATNARLNIGSRQPVLPEPGEDEHGQLLRMPAPEFLESWYADRHSAKALGYTNKVVDWLNQWMRERIYGESPAPFEPEERLVMVSTHEADRGALLHTEDELVVQGATPSEQAELPCWELVVRDEEGTDHTIYTLTAEQRHAYEARRKWLVQECRAGRERWPKYYRLIETFAQVRPGWATTIHKSQGSTYPAAYVVETNILDTASDPRTRDQLLYVAYSRAQTKLVLS